ncbi:MAG: hypothetical protein K8R36_25710 [Planctomycetales bacterium]|nr:hypothetical protein [Planctomycetales bacterium]
MVRQWSILSVVVTALVPVLFGCGSSSGPPTGKGLSDAELAKIMEGAKEDAANVPGPEITASALMESLLADPKGAGTGKEAIAGRKQMVTGKVIERSPEGSESSYLTVDGGTHNGKACKLKFNFAGDQREEIVDVKIGQNVRLVGKSNGEHKEDTLEFNECIGHFTGQPNFPPGGGGPPPLPKSK